MRDWEEASGHVLILLQADVFFFFFFFFCIAPAEPATLISVDRTGSDGKSITAKFIVRSHDR